MATLNRIKVDQLISPRFLRLAYQPIVDLDSGAAVGFEALARWPDLRIEPEEAFAVAARGGDLNVIDWACQNEAIRGAVAARLDPSLTLFVNAEPSSFGQPEPDGLTQVSGAAAHALRIVIEVTERALLHAPAELLRTIRHIRRRGWGVALDDVGAVPASLALLPFIAPDIIKLDLALVQSWPTIAQAKVMAAIMAHAERTGATILAEGIETEAHLEQALALGATIGQGWYFAQPADLPATTPPTEHPVTLVEPPGPTIRTPFAIVKATRTRIGRKGFLLGISRHLENQAQYMLIPPVVMAAFQDAGRFTGATLERYARLAEHCPLVAVLGDGLDDQPAPGVRGAALNTDDPLRGEWTVAVVGPHYAAALVARDLGDTGPDLDRRFSFVLTHDRELVLAAARSILERVAID